MYKYTVKSSHIDRDIRNELRNFKTSNNWQLTLSTCKEVADKGK